MTTVERETAEVLARSLTNLLDAARHRITDTRSELALRVTDHVGCPLTDMPNVASTYGGWELVNLHRALCAYLSTHSPGSSWFGIAGSGRCHQDVIDMLTTAAAGSGTYALGAVDYASVATGPFTSTDAISFGLVRSFAPDGTPVVIAVRDGSHCSIRVLARDRRAATSTISAIDALIHEHNVFSGQVLSFDQHEYGGNELVTFLPRPVVAPEDVVLPDGVLAAIERHVVRTPEQSRRLSEQGQHLKRGLLLYGPPGTGKTHTVRYLLGRLEHATVILLSGRALGWLGTAVALARRLTPSVLVLEDVDLIAEDRSRSSDSQPLLFELLNRIDGVDADVDVTFLLTTNRVDTLERALVQRPGRIDLAVEIPKPDRRERERLLRLYARGVELDLPDADQVTGRLAGVTASFVRELVRRAVMSGLRRTGDGDRIRLDERALLSALDELDGEQQRLTRSLLGAEG
jgi:hypothetical protein